MGKKRADGEGTYVKVVRKNKDTGKETEIWRYVVSVAGKRKYFSATGKGSKAAAKAKYDEYVKEHSGAPLTVDADIKLGVWIKKYLETCRKGTMKGTSYHQLELLADDIPNELNVKKVCDVMLIELQGFLNNFAAKASKSYVDKMAGLLKATFIEAQENGICIRNPTRKLKVPDKRQDPKQYFTAKEVETICNFAESYHQDIKNRIIREAGIFTGAAIITLLTTGLRRGELLGLMWSDITAGKLTVNRAVFVDEYEDGKQRPQVEEYRAKTVKSLRTIPLPPIAKQAVDKLPHRGLYIFSSESGGIMNPRNFSRSYDAFFDNLIKEHTDVRHLCPHECRHTCATLMIESGVDIRIVQEILGHEDINTTAHYTHPDFATMEQASGKFLGLIWCNNKCNNDDKQAPTSVNKA